MSDLTDKMISAAYSFCPAPSSVVDQDDVAGMVAAALRVLDDQGYSLAYRLLPTDRANTGLLTYPSLSVMANEIEKGDGK